MSETDDLWADALKEQEKEETTAGASASNSKSSDSGVDQDSKLNLIEDIEIELRVEIGRASLPIGQILKLAQGSVIELNVLAGEPLNVYANQTLIAQGEVVVVNDKFGIRLTDVIANKEKRSKNK